MMKELMDEGHEGWVLYLDADAYVHDLDFPIVEYLVTNNQAAMIAVRTHSCAEYWDINAGVLFLNFGHPVARAIVRDLIERLTRATQTPEFLANEWPDPDIVLDDQSLLQKILIENPRWQEGVRYEPQTMMNSLHATFIRHHLRAMTSTLSERIKSIQAEVDEVFRAFATVDETAEGILPILQANIP
jgi:hypothetical protein